MDEAKAKERRLTPKQERFCEEYLVDLNATQASIRAGYSAKTAEQQGPRLLGNVGVAARIDKLRAIQSKRTQVTADRVIAELARIAFLDLGSAYDSTGRLLHVQNMPEDVRRAIAGTKIFEEFEGFGKDREKIGETTEIKTVDKTRALELLGKHLKMFTEKLEHSGPDGRPIEFRDLSKLTDEQVDTRLQALLQKRGQS
jgi:phage terminase small subunit